MTGIFSSCFTVPDITDNTQFYREREKCPNMEQSKVVAPIWVRIQVERECRSGQEEQWRYTILIMILNLIFDQSSAVAGATWEQVWGPAPACSQ